jgi:hypothetical protein
MKVLIDNYVFDPALKRVTFSDYPSIELERVLLVTNVSINEIIYNFAEPTKGGTVSGNQLTLIYDTTAMSGSDKLQIFYENTSELASQETLQAMEDMLDYMKVLVSNTKVLATQDTLQRQRVVVENSVAINGTVNTQSIYNEINARQESSRIEFAKGIRTNLIF